ncbi:hypothetical protein [Haloactinomyces albus]|uniref:Uncharacterized protein n=1 Tax=Haloactinomyces albus TaxID=1352928 RepID=A0AAE3ZEV5_9ACTN|nr:hypothetical protein [Haloactinomyces albus]MDR7303617.1 hypothetical protein [Haloactinomyces albus]
MQQLEYNAFDLMDLRLEMWMCTQAGILSGPGERRFPGKVPTMHLAGKYRYYAADLRAAN